MMKNCTTTENQLERVVEKIFNMTMPPILEEIVEIEAIVDIPVLQFEFIFHVNRSFFLLWHGALHVLSLFIIICFNLNF